MTPRELALTQIKKMLDCPEIVKLTQDNVFEERKLLAWRVNMGITGERNDNNSQSGLSDNPRGIQTVLRTRR